MESGRDGDLVIEEVEVETGYLLYKDGDEGAGTGSYRGV
jgi:hypothetical protein